MKKRLVAVILCMVMVVGLFAGCTSSDGNTAASTGGASTDSVATDGEKSDVKYAVVLHALNSSFYAKIQEGRKKQVRH